MDDSQAKILEDLRDVVRGEVLVDELSRAAYATDASILQVSPLAVVCPTTVAELAELVRYAAENGLRLHPRGAGTGLAGESLGPHLVVDTSRYLTLVEPCGSDHVRVEAGARRAALQQYLRPRGRMFPPDPLSGDRCTLGGMIATDAAGPHALRYGSTRDYVVALDVVLADGTQVTLGRHEAGRFQALAEALRESNAPVDRPVTDRLAQQVAAILREHALDIEREQPAHLPKWGGYTLRGTLREPTVDLARLLVGAEGTLGFVAGAELATAPRPEHRALLLASFTSLDAAAEAVLESLEYQPVACEWIDRRLIRLVRETDRRFAEWVPPEAEALVLIEQEDHSAQNVRQRVRLTANRLGRVKRLACRIVECYSNEEVALGWHLRYQASAASLRKGDRFQPIDFIENVAVLPARLPEFLRVVQDVMNAHGVTASYAAHAGRGILHALPLLDLARPEDRDKLPRLAEAMLEAVLDFGGTANAEHGVGLLRTAALARQCPGLVPAFRKIKRVFDPHHRLNPGRIVVEEPSFPAGSLRPLPNDRPLPVDQESEVALPILRWSPTQPDGPAAAWATVQHAAAACNGCGTCRSGAVGQRMCPSFRAEPSEFAAPRSKANLLRHLLTGSLTPELLTSDDLRRVADYCVQCKMCKVECPSNVDIARLMLEVKAHHVAENGLSGPNAFFARLDSAAYWASAHALPVNWMLGRSMIRWLTEKLFGLSRRRRLPRFHHRTFLHRARRNGWSRMPRRTDPSRKVAILIDTFPDVCDPQLGECVVRVLLHQGFRVYVPPEQGPSGMASLHHGDVEGARAALQRNLRVFADLARAGYDIVSPEPSAVLMLRQEAPAVLDDPDLALVAERTYEFSEYIGELAEEGTLRGDLRPIPLKLGYHEPCHQRALPPRAGLVDWLGTVPQLQVESLELGCSGMAGTYGLRADGYERSLTAGSAMLDRVRQRDIDLAVTQCSACRLQIEEGAGKRTLHPAHWLALSYGLVTRPNRLLEPPAKGLLA